MNRSLLRRVAGAVASVLLLFALGGCGSEEEAAPRCTSVTRLALVAQSVPSAAYVPCIADLAPGWSVTQFAAERGGTTMSLLSDRAAGQPVTVRLSARCGTSGATAEPPRTAGGRTYLRLNSVSPRYSGTLYDVFPGGCVTYVFDFARGPHITLMEQLGASVALLPRRELRLDVQKQLGQELDP